MKCNVFVEDITLSKLILTNKMNTNKIKETDKSESESPPPPYIPDEFLVKPFFEELKEKRKKVKEDLEEESEIEDIKLSSRPTVVDFIEPLNVDYEDVDLMLVNKILLFKNTSGHHLTKGI